MKRILQNIWKPAKPASEQKDGKVDSGFINGRCNISKYRDTSPKNEDKRRFFGSFNEYKFLICTLCFSTSIVCCKILYANRDKFNKVYTYGKRLLSKPFRTTDFDILPKLSAGFESLWSVLVDFNWLFIPAVVGIATTFITWRFVYLDSSIPGIQPASPFSPKAQNKKLSCGVFSSVYMIGLYFGICAAFVFLLLWSTMST